MKIQFAFGANPRKGKKKSKKSRKKGGVMAKRKAKRKKPSKKIHKRKTHRKKRNPTFTLVSKGKSVRRTNARLTGSEQNLLMGKYEKLASKSFSKTRKGKKAAKKTAKKMSKISGLLKRSDKNSKIATGVKNYYTDQGYKVADVTIEANDKQLDRMLMAKKKKAKKKLAKKAAKKVMRKKSSRKGKGAKHRHGKRYHKHSLGKIKHVFAKKHYKGTLKLKGKAKKGEAKTLRLDISRKKVAHFKKGKNTKLKGFKGKVKANPMMTLDTLKSQAMDIVKETTPILGAVAVAPFLAGATQTALNMIPGVSTVDGYLQQFSGGRLNVGHVGSLALALGLGFAAKKYAAGNKIADVAAEGALAAAVLGIAQSLYGKEANMLASKVFPQATMAGVSYFPMSGVNYFPMSGEPQMGAAPQMGATPQMGDADYMAAKVLVGKEEDRGYLNPAGHGGDADYGLVDPVFDGNEEDSVGF